MKALLLTLLLTTTAQASDLFNGMWMDTVLLYFQDTNGWHWRTSHVQHVRNVDVGVCVQAKGEAPNLVKCWFISEEDRSVVVFEEVPLVGEERT